MGPGAAGRGAHARRKVAQTQGLRRSSMEGLLGEHQICRGKLPPDIWVPRGRSRDQALPPVGLPDRYVCVLARGQCLAGWKASDVEVHEAPCVIEDLADNPREVLLRTVFQHIGADHTIELSSGERAVRPIARVIAAHLIDAPIFGNTVGDLPAVDGDSLRPVLQPFARSVIQYRFGISGVDDTLDALNMR